MVGIDRSIPDTQQWAYPLLLVLSGVALGVSGLPAPLYGIYEANWHRSPLATTSVFAVYALAAPPSARSWSRARRHCWT